MVTRRIVYIFTLTGSVIFYILYSYWFSWYLLVLMLLLVPFDLLVSLPGMLTRRILLTAPNVLRQGADGSLSVTTLQRGPFHIKCMKIWIGMTCEDIKTSRRIICGAEKGSRYEIEIDTSRSGAAVFNIKRIWAVSLIGLFSSPVTVNCRAAVLILPAPLKPPQTISLPRGTTLRSKPGGGFSENHDLRGYRQGDPIRNIHWKVSAKHDTLIVREPLVPPLHSRLIHVIKWENPRERDLILGRLLWLSDYLLKLDLHYYIKLGDDEPIAEVTVARELEDYLYHVLSGASYHIHSPVSLPPRFTWEFRVDANVDGIDI